MPGSRKTGKNKAECLRYKTEGRLAKNKEAKLLRHKGKHPNDTPSKSAVNYSRKKPLEYFDKINIKKT